MENYEILAFFLIVSLIYSSVGFGGGSSYLAILALYALPFREIRIIALLCNLVVVTGATIIFIRNRQTDWRKIIPVAIASLPMAFLGGKIKISENVFFVVLGFSLLIAAVLLWIKTEPGDNESIELNGSQHLLRDGSLGGGVGFLSGMVGIGGGIFLAPLLNLLKWDTAKKIAATASVFIFVNSISGLAGQFSSLPSDINYKRIILLTAAVFLGGQVGSRIGMKTFNPHLIKRITSVLVFFAGIEVLSRHLPFLKIGI